jgi:hypothetical protein
MNVKEEIHSHIVGRFTDARSPIGAPKDPRAVFPPGKGRRPTIEHSPFENTRQINDIITDICENGPTMLNEITFLDHVR